MVARFVRYQPYLFQPVQSEIGRPFSAIVNEVRARWFPELSDEFEVRIAPLGPLACIWPHGMGRARHVIFFHPLLNRAGTPLEVVQFIAKHELTHIARPRRDGESHPPEFWEHEYAVAPERFAAWKWIHANIWRALGHGKHGLYVRRRWPVLQRPQLTPFSPELPLDWKRWDRVSPGDEAQLNMPPDWSPQPLPASRSGPRHRR